MKNIFLFLALAATVCCLQPEAGAQEHFNSRGLTFITPEKHWVDSVMEHLTLEQRIAQLMVVRVPLNMDDSKAQAFSEVMNGYGVGGVCFFVGTAERQVAITRILQNDASVPLLICIDGEWGLGMRLKDCYSFPKNDRFGRLTPDADSIVYRMGVEIGRQCREMGIHVNFAPVVDINSNPRNPVIGVRSFGIDRERVSQLGIMYALGQQSQGVLATAKHFPGHGDTETDSHLELPVINHTRAYIDSVDTYPFRRLIQAGVGGIMVAHLQVNALDPDRPSSLSPAVVDTLLRQQMGFDGLVVTDGLDMKGVTNTYGDGRGELAALLAGNDILLLPPDVPLAIDAIRRAANDDHRVRDLVDYHCRRVLAAKYRLVKPHMGETPRVPGAAHTAVCDAIVSDLNLNIDRRIDSVVGRALAAEAMPGCQVVVMHGGRTVVDRCYGRLAYDSLSAPVTPNTVYDLASLTKVCATTLAVMKLTEQGLLGIDDRLSRHLPYLRGTDKEDITVAQAMSHCARLKAFDAYWQQARGFDTILRLVADTPLLDKEGYLYSDLGFMLLADLVQRVSGQPLDEYVNDHFYRPMGLTHTAFNPLAHSAFQEVQDNTAAGTIVLNSQNSLNSLSPQNNIAPTELDTLRGLICGQVHDPNAHAMGGVSGHAGLFSTAREVARLMQMLLDGGTLDGHRYLESATVAAFTARHFARSGNRRALGFDKPLFNPSKEGPCCTEATQASYGHSGFTGTFVWVDPEYDLVYVFLSNRVHPSSTPNKLARMNVRTDIQSLLYEDIIKNE